MHQISVKVRSKGKVLKEVMVDQYDNLAEALEKQGEVACLSFINNGVKTKAMNNIRGEATGTKSKKLLRRLVMERGLVAKKEIDAALKQEDGFEKLRVLLDSKIPELEKQLKLEGEPSEADILEDDIREDYEDD